MKTVEDWHTRFVQQAQWTESIRQYIFNQVGYNQANKLLAVGCGTGAVLNEISASGLIHGLDIDLKRLNFAKAHNSLSMFTCGDAHRLPYSNNIFDLIFCHFLLLWVADPERTIDEMIRVGKPGSAILILAEPDYGGRIDFPESLQPLGQAQGESLRTQGADPRTGRKLAGWLTKAGLEDIQTGVIGGQWRGQPSKEEWEAEWQVLTSDLGSVITKEKMGEYKQIDKEAWESGSRVLFVPTFYGFGRVPKL